MNNREAAYKHFMQEEMRIGKSYQDIFNAGYQAALASQAQQDHIGDNNKLVQSVNALAAQTGESPESITEWLCDKGGLTQLSTCGVENTMGTQCNYVVIALCDDGTVWLNRNVDSHWDELPAIPQPEKKESKHTCQFSRSIIDGETETCSCGAWR